VGVILSWVEIDQKGLSNHGSSFYLIDILCTNVRLKLDWAYATFVVLRCKMSLSGSR
jgi:hypothetical protein